MFFFGVVLSTTSKAKNDHSKNKLAKEENVKTDVLDPNFKREISDKLDFALSFAMRCPSKESYINDLTKFLKENNVKGQNCEGIDFTKLKTFRSMNDAAKTLQKLGINTDIVKLPLNNIQKSLANVCAQVIRGESPEALGLLYDLSCSSKNIKEDKFLSGDHSTLPEFEKDEVVPFRGLDYQEAISFDINDEAHKKLSRSQRYRMQYNHLTAQREVSQYTDHYKKIGSKGWKSLYDVALAEALKGSTLVNDTSVAMSQDLKRHCSNFDNLDTKEKIKVWVALFDSMSMAESAHKTDTMYPESFGPISTGLLQISEKSARGHGGNCRGATTEGPENALTDPIFNLKCGVSIMESQMRTGKSIFGSKSYYWSVLNTRLGGYPKVMGRLNAIKDDTSRWPEASCNLQPDGINI